MINPDVLLSRLRNLLSICLVILLALPATGQDLHIYYDVFQDSIRLVRGDKEVNDYAVRKGYQVYLHSENYNNYIYGIEVLKSNRPTAAKNGLGFSSMMSMLSPGGLNPTSILGNMSGGSSLNLMNQLFGQTLGMSSDMEAAVMVVKSNYETCLYKINNLEQPIKQAFNDLKAEEEKIRRRSQVMAFVRDLKYNPNIPPVEIGRLALAEMKTILPSSVDGGDGRSRQQILVNLTEYSAEYQSQAGRMDTILLDANDLSSDYPGVKEMKTMIARSQKDSRVVLESLNNQINFLKQEIARDGGRDYAAGMAIITEYKEMEANTFSHLYRTDSGSEDMELQIVLTPRDSLNQPLAAGRREIPPMTIAVYGGLQVNASVGVSFGQFSNAPQTYFVRDSILRGDDESNFIPFLTTNVNFYIQSRHNLSFGGSFGVGLPLTGNENIETPAFFLGPTVVIGKGQRITLSAGAMAGRIHRLSQGYKVGDRYSSDANVVPTRTKYELGYFAGISFNM